MDLLISDPALGLTESQCLVLAKNHTLAVSNVNGTAPANVWNFCATGVCNYTFANGTTGVFVSPYAGSHTASVCQLGYSSAVDNNDYLEAAVIQAPGQGNAGKGGRGGLLSCCLTAFAFACHIGFLSLPFVLFLPLPFYIAFLPLPLTLYLPLPFTLPLPFMLPLPFIQPSLSLSVPLHHVGPAVPALLMQALLGAALLHAVLLCLPVPC